MPYSPKWHLSAFAQAIVLGTGLKECILSGLLSVEGYKVRQGRGIAPHCGGMTVA